MITIKHLQMNEISEISFYKLGAHVSIIAVLATQTKNPWFK